MTPTTNIGLLGLILLGGALLAPAAGVGKAREIGGGGVHVPEPEPEMFLGQVCGPWRYVTNVGFIDITAKEPCDLWGACRRTPFYITHTPPQCEATWDPRATCANITPPALSESKNFYYYERDLTALPSCICELLEVNPAEAVKRVVPHC